MPFFDTHVHWTHELLWPTHASLIQKAHQEGVTDMLTVCLSLSDLKKADELRARESSIYLASALHPTDSEDALFENEVAKYAREGKLLAIGETGIDLFRDTIPVEIQKKRFIRHLELALEVRLPVVVHVRKALPIVLEVLDAHYIHQKHARRGIIHCFEGDKEDYKKIVQRDWLVGIGGSLTYKRAEATRTCMKVVRRCDYVLETDAPFLPPDPNRKSINHSGNIPTIAKYVANLRGEIVDDVAHDTYSNARALFGLELI